jgi:hypothetical protein
MHSTKRLLTLGIPTPDEVSLCVEPLAGGRYGVFTGAVLVAIHQDQGSANALCKRLLRQQADEISDLLLETGRAKL